MINRFALFEGQLKPGTTEAFRAAVSAQLVPLWRQFPGNTDVHISFGGERDESAPEFPLKLAISSRDPAALEQALTSPFRAQSRDGTAQIVAQFFKGRIHHHVTEDFKFKADVRMDSAAQN
jgi:hypothetical protein